MGELKSAQQIHLCQVPEAQFITQTAEHDFEDDVGRKLKIVEWRARPLIGFAPTTAAAKYGVTEFGAAAQVPESGRLAVRTDHGRRRRGTSEYRMHGATSPES